MSDYENDPMLSLDEEQEEASTMTLSAAAGAAPPPIPGASGEGGSEKQSSSKLLTQGSLIIVLVAVIAAGAIYTMRLTGTEVGTNVQAKTVEAKVEQAIAKLTRPDALAKDDPLRQENIQNLFSDPDRIVTMLSNNVTDRQVPIEFVKKNPFELANGKKEEVDPDAGDHRAEKAARERYEKLARELEGLKLQTVITGARPIAVINGEMLQQGMTLGSFTIEEINGKGAVLSAGEHRFELGMESEVQGKNNRLFNQ